MLERSIDFRMSTTKEVAAVVEASSLTRTTKIAAFSGGERVRGKCQRHIHTPSDGNDAAAAAAQGRKGIDDFDEI